MTPKPYSPLPGTVASKTIAWLMDQPAGISYSCAVIADATDTDANGMIPNLSTAVAHGLVVKDKIDGLVRYRLGNGQPPAPLDDEPVDGILVPAQIWTPAAGAPTPSAPEKPAVKKARRTQRTAAKVWNAPGCGPVAEDHTPRKDQSAIRLQGRPMDEELAGVAQAPAAPASAGFFVGASMGGDIQIHKGGVMLTLDDQEFAFAIRMAAALYPNTYTQK